MKADVPASEDPRKQNLAKKDLAVDRKIKTRVEGNVEDSEETPSSREPVPEEPRDPETIAGEIRGIGHADSEELERLNSEREKLGLPPVTSNAAIEGRRNNLEALRREYEQASGRPSDGVTSPEDNDNDLSRKKDRISQETVQQQEMLSLRNELTKTAETFSRLGSTFQQREQNQLYPLLEQQDVSKIMFGARMLSEGAQGGKPHYDNITQALGAMRQGLEQFGSYRSRVVDDNPDSLRGIATFTRQAADSIGRLHSALERGDAQAAQDAMAEAGALVGVLEKVWQTAGRKSELLSQYLSGGY